VSSSKVDLRFRSPRSVPESRGGSPPNYRRTVENGMIIQRDVTVPTRFGFDLYVDIFRPEGEAPAAPLVGWTPYGKHNPAPIGRIYPNSGVLPEHTSEYTIFEAPDPLYWVPHGYAIINADIPGTWNSKAKATYLSPEEAEAFYDLIEWAGVQPWSLGKVGLSGVSYLTSSQWRVAELNPPHLGAFNPWEGWSDTYREVARHGGIPETSFWPYIWDRWGASHTEVEDLERETREHPFFDDFWASKACDFARIKAPAYIVASWSDQGLHTRGTFEGFRRISSEHKWLEAHGRKKWAYYYLPESLEKQRAFFDHFLKGQETAVTSWPKVQVEARERYYVGRMRAETAWPLEGTEYRKLYLEAASGSLKSAPVEVESAVDYSALGSGPDPHRAIFDITFEEPVELIGYMKARLFMSTTEGDDLDVFVGLWKLNREGSYVPFAYYAQYEDGPLALGWIRASHRELDEARSSAFQPVLAHRRELKLNPGETAELNIEIWPSGTRFEAGETLRLVVQGTDIHRYPKPSVYARHEETVNRGRHRIHTGGRHGSFLQVPVAPVRSTV
jgi:predicted acyl esterase